MVKSLFFTKNLLAATDNWLEVEQSDEKTYSSFTDYDYGRQLGGC